jgi:hypothetical protein
MTGRTSRLPPRMACAKDKAKDPEEYKAKASKNKKNFVDKHSDAVKKAYKRSIAKAVAEKRHYCAICDHVFTKKAKLTKHLAGPKPAAMAARYQQQLLSWGLLTHQHHGIPFLEA